jgi:hypothetical protein
LFALGLYLFSEPRDLGVNVEDLANRGKNYCRVLPTSMLTPSLQVSLTLRIYDANIRGSSCMQVEVAYLVSSLTAKIQDQIRIPSFFIQFAISRYASLGKEFTYK